MADPFVRFTNDDSTVAQPGDSAENERVQSALGKRSILVVEDEPDALDAVIELLRDEGFTAVGARNGEEALSLLESGLRPALALVDLKMPIMNGWDLCAALRADERFADMAVAIVTASASPFPLPDRWKDGGYFSKPINYDRLLKIVRQFCA